MAFPTTFGARATRANARAAHWLVLWTNGPATAAVVRIIRNTGTSTATNRVSGPATTLAALTFLARFADDVAAAAILCIAEWVNPEKLITADAFCGHFRIG